MYYSNIFNIYQTKDKVVFFNILKKIQLPDDKTTELYKTFIVPYKMPWTSLSYMVYGDIKYYWLLLLANSDKKLNPLYANVSDNIFIINPSYLEIVIEAIEKANI